MDGQKLIRVYNEEDIKVLNTYLTQGWFVVSMFPIEGSVVDYLISNDYR